jgi:methionyl-tRNA formyltransferase
VAYGNLIPQNILDIPKIAPINIHGSLLPAYRGASPLQTVFLDGLTETGITLMKMEAGLDSGPMIDKQIFKLGFSDTVADLIQRVKDHTPRWSLDSIDNYVHGELEEETQDDLLVTHCGKIEKEDGLLDIENDTLEYIYRKYKAYYLWPKTFMKLKVKNDELRNITIDELVIDEDIYNDHKDK